LCYAITRSSYSGGYTIVIYKGKMDEGRLLDGLEEWSSVERALIKPPQYVTDEDLGLLRLLWKHRDKYDGFLIPCAHGHEILTRLVDSGRLFLWGTLQAAIIWFFSQSISSAVRCEAPTWTGARMNRGGWCQE
jgi:hypothetical protein